MPNYTIDRKTEHFHTLESYFALERKPIESKKQIKRVRATQDRRVRQLMCAAYDIPFYRQRFEESGTKPEDYTCAEDLYQFPLLTKDDLRAWMSGEETEHPEKYEAWHVAPTSGSTGKPLRSLFSPRENAWLTANWLRVMSYGGYNPFTGKI